MPTAAAPDPRATPAPDATAPVIAFEEVSLAFDEKVILDRISFTLLPGRLKVILGASGSGKSTILRLILGLLKPDSGRIFVAGQRIDRMREADLMTVRAQLGMVFQEGALFDSLTVGENVGFRLYEETDQPLEAVDARVREEACPHDLAPTTSTTVALVLGDALAVALLQEKGFQPEDFARIHPGGALGRRLVIQIEEIMLRQDLPVLDDDATMRDAIVMSPPLVITHAELDRLVDTIRAALDAAQPDLAGE